MNNPTLIEALCFHIGIKILSNFTEGSRQGMISLVILLQSNANLVSIMPNLTDFIAVRSYANSTAIATDRRC